MNIKAFLDVIDSAGVCDEAKVALKGTLKSSIKKQREVSAEKKRERDRKYRQNHPQRSKINDGERNRKGGKYYERRRKYESTGLQGERHRIRTRHAKKWRQYKRIVALDSQIHHAWQQGTAKYTGVALVETDQHRHGIIDVIQILDGEITVFSERELIERGEL